MRIKTTFSRFFLIALSAVCFSPLLACAQAETVSPPGGGPTAEPGAEHAAAAEKRSGANNETYKTLKSQCETPACGKGNGDICANAAAILLGDDPPDEFREMNEAQRTKIALRLLEKGVDSSNIATGRAYDLYSKTDVFGFGSFGGYSDSYRANELMDMMIKKSYPGGALRKARTALSFFSLTVTEDEKKESCAVAKRLLAEGKLDADSAKIANEVIDNGNCKNLDQGK